MAPMVEKNHIRGAVPTWPSAFQCEPCRNGQIAWFFGAIVAIFIVVVVVISSVVDYFHSVSAQFQPIFNRKKSTQLFSGICLLLPTLKSLMVPSFLDLVVPMFGDDLFEVLERRVLWVAVSFLVLQRVVNHGCIFFCNITKCIGSFLL